MITIYHNPRCGKSRDCVAHFEKTNESVEIIKYLDKPLSKEEIQSILKKLNYTPIQLIRVKESVWVENYKGKSLTDDDMIEAMLTYPILIERPIVIKGNKAVVARPLENINKLR
jgi:arsenate reductase